MTACWDSFVRFVTKYEQAIERIVWFLIGVVAGGQLAWAYTLAT